MKIRNYVVLATMVLGLALPLSSYAVDTGTVQSIAVYNDTKNKDAVLQSADKEDFLTFTLTVKNNSTQVVTSYSPVVNLSYVLDFADMLDRGGAKLSGSILTYPSVSIPSGSSITRSFKVRVKYFIPTNNNGNMVVTFGNTVTVGINRPSITMTDIGGKSEFKDTQVLGVTTGTKTAPKTGADMNALYFAFIFPAVYEVISTRKKLLELVK